MCHMPVKKVENDNEYVPLYINPVGLIYKMMVLAGYSYPEEQTLFVYERVGTPSLEIMDSWGNKYLT